VQQLQHTTIEAAGVVEVAEEVAKEIEGFNHLRMIRDMTLIIIYYLDQTRFQINCSIK
jgi:hypothetical protein